jgi:imidazolonepropionase-like amidohydrolase
MGIVDDKEDDHVPLAVAAAQIFANLSEALDAGFTTVRDVGGLDGGVAAAVAHGLVRGPRILPSGPIICEAGGNGDLHSPFCCGAGRRTQGHPGLSWIGAPCYGPDDARVAARLALRRGATQLKVSVNTLLSFHDTGSPDTELTEAEIAVVVGEARAKGTYVTALALRAGVECLEHGGIATEEVATAVAAAGVPLVPTLTNMWLLEQDGNADGHRARLELQESLLLAKANGVTVGSGSDLEGFGQPRRGMELVLRAQLETPMEALLAATAINGRILRRPELGRIGAGCAADLIAVSGNPLDEPQLFDDPARVVLVLQGGRVVKDLRLDGPSA